MRAPNSSVNRMIDSVAQTRGRYHMSRRCFKAINLIVCRVTGGVNIHIYISNHTYMFIYILYMIEIPVQQVVNFLLVICFFIVTPPPCMFRLNLHSSLELLLFRLFEINQVNSLQK